MEGYSLRREKRIAALVIFLVVAVVAGVVIYQAPARLQREVTFYRLFWQDDEEGEREFPMSITLDLNLSFHRRIFSENVVRGEVQYLSGIDLEGGTLQASGRSFDEFVLYYPFRINDIRYEEIWAYRDEIAIFLRIYDEENIQLIQRRFNEHVFPIGNAFYFSSELGPDDATERHLRMRELYNR